MACWRIGRTSFVAAIAGILSGCAANPGDLVELSKINQSFVIDARYSTKENFVGVRFYPANRIFLRRDVAAILNTVEERLSSRALRLKIWDGYRPLAVQRRMWSVVPDERYVADPKKGSNHNRGCAVDLTVVDSRGQELAMPTPFDDFTPRAHRDYTELPENVLQDRQLLAEAMQARGFVPLPTEWWHFDAKDCAKYPVLDVNPFGAPWP